ncbi:hypothetical protein J6590_009998 [Homalodisca vitripennis]|nr:hypothetical protein J6590_009998 [Homalodisca vitripennis]
MSADREPQHMSRHVPPQGSSWRPGYTFHVRRQTYRPESRRVASPATSAAASPSPSPLTAIRWK